MKYNDNKKDKKIYRATFEKVVVVPKESEKPVSKKPDKRVHFRLDSSAYYKSRQPRQVYRETELKVPAVQNQTSNPVRTKKPATPDVSPYLTTQIPFSQFLEGMQDRYAKAKSAAENNAYDLGGHLTQTIELSLIDSEMIRAADTLYGVYVEIDESAEPRKAQTATIEEVFEEDSRLAEGIPERYAKAKIAAEKNPVDLGGHLTQTIELSLIDSEMIRAADTRFGVFVEIEEPIAVPKPEAKPGAYEAPAAHRKFSYPPDSNLAAGTAVAVLEDEDKGKAFPEPLVAVKQTTLAAFFKKLFTARFIAFLVLAVMLFTPLTLFSTVYKMVYVHIDGKMVFSFVTSRNQVEEMFRESGFELRPADRYEVAQAGLYVNIVLDRSSKITVLCDGKVIEHYVLNKTAAEALDELGVVLGEDDETNIGLDTMLYENDVLEVYRVHYEYYDKTEVVQWLEVEKYSPLIKTGEKRVMNSGGGRDGEAVRTYREKYVNGELTQIDIENEKITKYPVDVVTLVGDDSAAMSPIDGAEFTDIHIVDNEPEEYMAVIDNGICTAYSFSPGTYGASGMYLFQGFVAVNPNVIPYGTLLYITSQSGEFVYGWAIAADIGTAMMEGYVDIDCFFETYGESVLFGKKTMNIYLVKQLTQSDLEVYIGNSGMFQDRIPK